MSLLSLTKRMLGRKQEAPKKAKTQVKDSQKAPAKKPEAVRETAEQGALGATSTGIDLQPLITEKGMDVQADAQTVVFRVRPQASKRQIAQAVFAKYNVKPISIQTALMHPKTRRRGQSVGQTAVWKKAYVKVRDVQSLNLAP